MSQAPEFILSQADARPMYLQIMEQVQQRVLVGDWPAGTKLPSIRELAVSLNVSVITVKRAYLELEREGVIVTRHGRGSWIADTTIEDRRLEELTRHLQQAAEVADQLDIDTQELTAMLQALRDGSA